MKTNLLLSCTCLAVIGCLPRAASADTIGYSTYQSPGTPYNTSVLFQNNASPNAAEFTLMSSATISRVVLPLSESGSTSIPVNVSILSDTGGSGPGTVLGTVVATGVPTGGYNNIGNVTADFSALHITLAPNTNYWLAEGSTAPTTVYWEQTAIAGLPDPYGSTGTLAGPWVAYSPVTKPPAMEVFVVPEPGTWSFLALAGAAFVVARVRQTQRAAVA